MFDVALEWIVWPFEYQTTFRAPLEKSTSGARLSMSHLKLTMAPGSPTASKLFVVVVLVP